MAWALERLLEHNQQSTPPTTPLERTPSTHICSERAAAPTAAPASLAGHRTANVRAFASTLYHRRIIHRPLGMADQFDAAAAHIKEVTGVSQDNQLKLYGLFKQAQKGDVTGDRPGMFDWTGRAKYDAWEAVKGKDTEAAKTEYVALVKELSPGFAG